MRRKGSNKVKKFPFPKLAKRIFNSKVKIKLKKK